MPATFRPLLVLLLATLSGAAELKLQPTELVLVDGRTVQGQLATELDTHLIVYSPGLGTLKSFRKEFVASYTKDKKPIKVSAPRALSPEELKVDLDWNGWVDAPPEKGPKPAYTTQKWGPPQRLVVWKTLKRLGPGKNQVISGQNQVAVGMFQAKDADNWLVLGAPLPADGNWDVDTDVILPGVAIEDAYAVHGPFRRFRHLSAENHAWAAFGDDKDGMAVAGNLWVHERGRCYVPNVKTSAFVGPSHTFCKNERPAIFDACKGGSFNVDAKDFIPLTWDNRGYRLSQYIMIRKDPGASVEFLGSHLTGDKFWTYSGTTIIGPDSSVHADTRSGDKVYKDGTLQLMSGAHWSKFQNKMTGGDIEVEGLVEFGTKERPLTKDVVVSLSWKDFTDVNHKEKNHKPDWEPCGFQVYASGKVRMASADPKTARVVFRYLNRDTGPAWSSTGRPRNTPSPFYKELPRRIDLLLLGDVQLDGVLFEDLHKGGIRLADPGMRSRFKNVVFGKNCGSDKPDELFSVFKPGVAPIGWSEDPVVIKATAEQAASAGK